MSTPLPRLSWQEVRILQYVEKHVRHVTPSQRSIAEAVGLSPTTVNRLLASLARKGYLEREDVGVYRVV